MRLLQAVLVASSLLFAAPALAHSGGLNKCGCHVNHKTGDCHCHQDRGCGCSCQPAHCPGVAQPGPESEGDFIQRIAARGGGGRGSNSKGSTTHVRGYTTKRGTYVEPHQRTAPDKSKANNWSTKGNVNPYTGKEGTKEPVPK